MFSKKSLSILFTSIVFCSCSSQPKEQFLKKDISRKRNEDLIQSFEGKSKILEKFKQKKVTKKIEDPKVDKQRSKRSKKQLKKQSTNKETLSKSSTSQKRKNKKVIVKKSLYPSDYPEAYKDIDAETKKYWSLIKPRVYEGEKYFMDLNYAGVSTGKVVITTHSKTRLGEQDVYHFHARVKTSSYYSYLYELDDNIESFVNPLTFTPVKFSLIQRESSQNVDDLQLFDKDELKTYAFYKRDRGGKVKKSKKIKYTPTRFQDALSVLYTLRGLPYKKGQEYTIPMMNKGKVLLLRVQFDKFEVLDTEIGEKKAIKVLASTQYSGETLKSGRMSFWFTDDEQRIFLRFKAKIKIGSVSGDIEKYER